MCGENFTPVMIDQASGTAVCVDANNMVHMENGALVPLEEYRQVYQNINSGASAGQGVSGSPWWLDLATTAIGSVDDIISATKGNVAPGDTIYNQYGNQQGANSLPAKGENKTMMYVLIGGFVLVLGIVAAVLVKNKKS